MGQTKIAKITFGYQHAGTKTSERPRVRWKDVVHDSMRRWNEDRDVLGQQVKLARYDDI